MNTFRRRYRPRHQEVVLETVTVRELLVTGLLAFLVLAVALLAFFGVGFATGERLPFAHDHFGSDVWHQNLPFRAFYQRGLAEGRLPHWCPEFGTGYPLLAEGQVGALYPPNLLLHGLLPLATAFNLSILLTMALAGTFAAAYARQLGATRGPALLAGLVFGLSGWYLVHLKHVNYTAAAAWAPLLLLLLERIAAGSGRRTVALLAGVIGTMHFIGCPQITYYNLLLGSLYALLLALRRGGWRDRVRPVAAWFGAVLVGFLLGAPQLLPSLELKELGPRRGGLSRAQATFTAMQPRHLLLFVAPNAFGDHGDLEEVPLIDRRTGLPRVDPRTGRPVTKVVGFEADRRDCALPWEVTGYVGILPLLLAAAAIALSLRRRAVAWTAGLFVLSILLALAPSVGLYDVLYHVLPGFSWFRVFGRFLVYADLFLAVLAALGLTRLLAFAPEKRRRIVGIAASVAAAAICFVDVRLSLASRHSTVEAAHWLSPPATVTTIRARERDSTEPFRFAAIDPLRRVFRNAHYRAGGWVRNFERYEPARLCLAPNMGILFGLSTADIYTPMPLPWVQQVMDLLPYDADPRTLLPAGFNPRISRLLNIRYVIDPFDTSVAETLFVAEYPGDVLLQANVLVPDGPPYRIRLLADPAALPRAFLAGGARTVRDEPWSPGGNWSAAQNAIADEEWDPYREVLLTAKEAVEAVGTPGPVEGTVRFGESGPTRVVLDVEAEREAWLFLGETWYPGWEATVNGRATPVRRANSFGRAVRVPAGRHEVIFTYRPVAFRRGLLLAGLAAAVLLVLLAPWPGRFRRRNPDDRSGAP